eukprot:TRINITY_DN106916_c0_g1_i1.p1 TRINITY_DN106916_c0_g1~~TRINITY_DN106916_c0_g1_i1.p1  ORF type:complete len:586 (+),score=114.02 TRINITY_DN106916_c0_g1_i1:49-1758(+)
MATQAIEAAPSDSAPTDRIQVLVLHGRQSNQNLSGFQINALKSACGKDVDFNFLDGNIPWSYRPGIDLHEADQMSVSLSKGMDMKVWFMHTTDDKRPRPDLWQQQDPSVTVNYENPDAAVDALLERVRDGPRVDVVLGLFEGSIIVHLAAARLMQQNESLPWELSVFFGSLPIRDDKYATVFAQGRKAAHKTIHVFGRHDEYYFYGRHAAGRVAPEDYYENALVMEHEEGHRLPGSQPDAGRIYGRIATEMRYCLGFPLPDGTHPMELHTWRRTQRPPKPISHPILDLDVMVPRKLRILCLCGGHSCAELVKFQTTALRMAIGKDAADWIYIEGTEDWPQAQKRYIKEEEYDAWFAEEPVVSDMEKKLSKGAQLKNWYMDTLHEVVPSNKPNREKQFDPTTRVIYHDVVDNIEKLRKQIIDEGPFDVLVAFSQGCIMTHLLIGHMRKETPTNVFPEEHRRFYGRDSGEEMPWRLSVFFSGMHIRDKDYMNLFDTPSPHPTVHVFGKEDEFYDYGRDGFENKPQEEYYVDPLVMTHGQGHMFPSDQPRAKQIYDRVAQEVWKYCGGSRGP